MLSAEGVAAVDANLRAKHECHLVPNSIHWPSYSATRPTWGAVRSAYREGLFSCPPEPEKNVRETCMDAPGFDRVAFHEQLNVDVLAFLRANLGHT
jgi:hypothetical protein